LDEKKNAEAIKVRFYASLEAMLLAWAAISLALGAALSLNPAVHYTMAMTGLLVILGLAMRTPTYRQIRPLRG